LHNEFVSVVAHLCKKEKTLTAFEWGLNKFVLYINFIVSNRGAHNTVTTGKERTSKEDSLTQGH
jgi:hypothetical protein